MNKQVIFNLAVSDLDRFKAFFASLGFHFKPQYSSDNTAYMVVVDDCIHAMLMTEVFFASLIDKPVASAHQANEVIICLSCESREELEGLIARARCGRPYSASAGRPWFHGRPGIRGPRWSSVESGVDGAAALMGCSASRHCFSACCRSAESRSGLRYRRQTAARNRPCRTNNACRRNRS